MPTIKQLRVIENLPASTSTSMAGVLRKAGYSEATVRKPQQVLQSKGLAKLIEQSQTVGLTDEYCIGRLKLAMEGKDLKAVVAAISLWWSIKYPNSKKDGLLAVSQLNLEDYSQEEQLADAFYLVRRAQLSKGEVLRRAGY